MLYWAEGAKDRGLLTFANSDRAMVAFFWRFLTIYFEVDRDRVRFRLNVYLNNGLALSEIVAWWNDVLGVPEACFRNHVTDHCPTSSSGRRRNKLPHGVCTLRLADVRVLQHIYGAIQEYAGFEEPRWLDAATEAAAEAAEGLDARAGRCFDRSACAVVGSACHGSRGYRVLELGDRVAKQRIELGRYGKQGVDVGGEVDGVAVGEHADRDRVTVGDRDHRVDL